MLVTAKGSKRIGDSFKLLVQDGAKIVNDYALLVAQFTQQNMVKLTRNGCSLQSLWMALDLGAD